MKEEILEYFKDINLAYNDCTRFDTLKRMLGELEQEQRTIQEKQVESERYQKAFDDGYANGYAQARFDYEPKTDTLDKIRAEIEQNAYPIVHGVNNHEKGMTLYGILQIIDKYKAESEEV